MATVKIPKNWMPAVQLIAVLGGFAGSGSLIHSNTADMQERMGKIEQRQEDWEKRYLEYTRQQTEALRELRNELRASNGRKIVFGYEKDDAVTTPSRRTEN